MNVNLNNTDNNDYVRGYKDGKKAGATATHDRSKVLVDALKDFISYHETGLLPARHVYEKGVKSLEQWEGKEEVKDEPNPPPDLGTCKECKTRPAVTDYNGHGHYVCQLCDNSLNREFDEEYR